MLAGYFSPLAPAAGLLLGAFILSVILPRLPMLWQTRPELHPYRAPILVGLAILALLGARLTLGEDTTGEGLEMLSGWNFSTADSAAALTVRVDSLSLVFLSLTLLILLAVTLAGSGPSGVGGATKAVESRAGWLVLGASAALLFVAGNGLTIGYALFIFEILTALYWLRQRQTDLSVARLFLAILTASGLALLTIDGAPGALLLGLALWLRLGLYPFIEAAVRTRQNDEGWLIYLALTLAVSFYLVIRAPVAPVPGLVRWLVVLTMLLNGLLTWLAEARPSFLTRLVLTAALPILLVGTLADGIGAAYAAGLILSLGALWMTPRLGQPRLTERAWPWPYLPAAGATLTLLGLPLWLGWPVRSEIYQTLFRSESLPLVLAVILAEALGLSSLYRYWLLLWTGADRDGRRAAAATIMMVPFLLPGLATFILGLMTQSDIPLADLAQPFGVFVTSVLVVAGAIGFGHYRAELLRYLRISPAALTELLSLRWFLSGGTETLQRASKATLRLRVFLEGQHYIGWALFTALVGALIIFLR
jgi:hypothetical protein